MEKGYYKIDEFAFLLHVHVNTIRRGIKKGHIMAFKVGVGKNSSYRIAHSEIERLASINLEGIINKIAKERYDRGQI